jgi:hypothetical protein
MLLLQKLCALEQTELDPPLLHLVIWERHEVKELFALLSVELETREW